MPNQSKSNRSGTSGHPAGSGRQAHKSDDSQTKSAKPGVKGGTPEQHAMAGRQSHKNDK